MGRRKRTEFGEVTTTQAAFDRSEAQCPSCRRPIGPEDRPRYATAFGGSSPALATMRCRRCNAELTVHFMAEEQQAS
jgi:hypothetical protein